MASNGLEAIAAFDLGAFDAILMDMQMPEMDGLTAIEAIREREWRLGLEHTPIAVLSANAMAEHLEASFEVGADAHISKPVTPDALNSGLMSLLQKRHPKLGTLQRAQTH
jgi:CheY-like chemotaxis protein